MGQQYEDSRGWSYKVMPGLGKAYKARYLKPGGMSWHCVARLPWRETAQEAQTDLDNYAKKKGWWPI